MILYDKLDCYDAAIQMHWQVNRKIQTIVMFDLDLKEITITMVWEVQTQQICILIIINTQWKQSL